ncbi:MAG: hypothetical protein AAGE01_22500 [Pseudomonadota bacterium]
MNSTLRTITSIALLAMLGACATTPPMPDDAQARAQQRWDAQLAGDFDTAYAYFSPGYRAAFALDAYEAQMRARTVRWVGATAVDQECEGTVCKVRISIEYDVDLATRGAGSITSVTSVVERWIESDGTWYLVPDRLR